VWQSLVRIFYTTARNAPGILRAASLLLFVPIAALIFIVEIYRFLVRVIVVIMVDRRRIVVGTGEDGRS
jgi:hypothetical protein